MKWLEYVHLESFLLSMPILMLTFIDFFWGGPRIRAQRYQAPQALRLSESLKLHTHRAVSCPRPVTTDSKSTIFDVALRMKPTTRCSVIAPTHIRKRGVHTEAPARDEKAGEERGHSYHGSDCDRSKSDAIPSLVSVQGDEKVTVQPPNPAWAIR